MDRPRSTNRVCKHRIKTAVKKQLIDVNVNSLDFLFPCVTAPNECHASAENQEPPSECSPDEEETSDSRELPYNLEIRYDIERVDNDLDITLD